MAISNIGGASASSASAASGNVTGLNVMASGWSSIGYYALPSPKKTRYALSHQDSTNGRLVIDYGTTGNAAFTDFFTVPGDALGTTLNSTIAAQNVTNAAVYGQWDRKSTPNTANGGVGYLNGVWFYGDTSGRIYSSPDLTTWTLRGTPVAATIRGFAYGNSVYCAVGYVSTTGMNATSTDGITWTNRTTGTLFTDVTFGAGKFVAASNSTNMNYSTDGFTWTTVSGAIQTVSVAHNGLAVGSGSLFVGVGSGGIATSPDGVTWTSRSNPSGLSLNSVTYGNGVWVAVGASSTIISSSDGLTWNSYGGTGMTNTATTFNAVAYGAGKFFACADYINAAGGYGGGYVSTNGITWRPAGACSNNAFPLTVMRSMIFANGRFVCAVGNGYLATSTDGLQGLAAGFTVLGLGSPTIN